MMIERTGKYIGTGVASVINLLNIERIVLGGGVMDAGSLILNPIIQEVKRAHFNRVLKPPRSSRQTRPRRRPIGAALLAATTQNTD
jgi:glucokinase